MQDSVYELRRITLPRTPVNRARDGEDGPSPYLLRNGCGQGASRRLPVVVIDSYAIPDNSLTAAYLVTSYWPRTTLLPEEHRSIRPTTHYPDARCTFESGPPVACPAFP
jgi:hypothetical protein